MDARDILERRWVIPAAVGVTTLACGFTAGYIIGKKKGVIEFMDEVRDVYEASGDAVIMEEPADDQGNLFEQLVYDEKNDILVFTEDNVEAAEQFLNERAAMPVADIPDVEEVVLERKSVFMIDKGDWDYAVEQQKRSQTEPYVIHVDEFMAGESGYERETLTYYAGDDKVADPQDVPVYDFNELLGPLRWGHGTNGDSNVVYIRNDQKQMEWEVVLHTGSYEIEVMGLQYERDDEEQEIKHMNNRRFRDDD